VACSASDFLTELIKNGNGFYLFCSMNAGLRFRQCHLPHRTVHIIEHKASSYIHNITHRFSIVICSLPNSSARFTQCCKLAVQTETTNEHVHNIRGNSKMVNIYKHAYTFSHCPAIEPRALRSQVGHSTTIPLPLPRSQFVLSVCDARCNRDKGLSLDLLIFLPIKTLCCSVTSRSILNICM